MNADREKNKKKKKMKEFEQKEKEGKTSNHFLTTNVTKLRKKIKTMADFLLFNFIGRARGGGMERRKRDRDTHTHTNTEIKTNDHQNTFN